MKTFYKSSELPHLWAHNLTQGARCPSAESIQGDAYRSYGTDIGRRYEHNGEVCFIVNDTSYSVTTSTHQSAMRRAIPDDATVFHVGNLQTGSRLEFGTHKQTGAGLFEYAVEQSKDCAIRAEKAKGRKAILLEQQASWLAEAGKINEWFGLRRKVDEQTIERAKVAQQRLAARKVKEERERIAKNAEQDQRQIQAWLRGEGNIHMPHYLPVYLRSEEAGIRGDYRDIVTSRGARISYEAGKRTFEFAMKARAKGWHKNGDQFPIDSYSLDAVNDAGIVAGCHRISWSEIERFAQSEGWTVPA